MDTAITHPLTTGNYSAAESVLATHPEVALVTAEDMTSDDQLDPYFLLLEGCAAHGSGETAQLLAAGLA